MDHQIPLSPAKLQALLESFFLLTSSLDLDTVLHRTLEKATELMRAEKGSIALINENRSHLEFVETTDPNARALMELKIPLGNGIAGSVAQSGRPERIQDVAQDPRFYDKVDEALNQKTQSYLCVPLEAEEKIIGTIQIMNQLDGESFTEADEDLLMGFARQAGLAIHNARLHQIEIKQQQIESEMALCKEIQQNIFPKRSPEIEGFSILGNSVPSKEVGGDYFNFIPRPDGSYDCILADVSGKGISAALMVSELHSCLHLLSPMEQSLNDCMQKLNDYLQVHLLMGKFITLFALRIYPGQDEFEYVLAGHPSPFLVRANGTLDSFASTGMVLGLSRQKIGVGKSYLAPGDLLFAFTDGYSEAMDPKGNMIDTDGLLERFLPLRRYRIEHIQKKLREEITDFRQGEAATDDDTLLLIRREE